MKIAVPFLAAALMFDIVGAGFARSPFETRLTPGQARDAVREGQHRTLSEISRDLRNRYGGDRINADLVSRGGRTIYLIRWRTRDGRILDLEVDPTSGAVLSERGG